MTARLIAAIVLCLTAGSPCLAAGAGNTIDNLLADQASAFERFDVDAYLATFVPERREAERQLFGREFTRLSGGLPALGVALARNRLEGGLFTVDSRAFYINGALFSGLRGARRLTPETRRITVAHELVHLALAAQSRPFTPPWLKEGAAVYFSGDLSFDANRRLVRAGMDHLSLAVMTRARALGQHGLVATAGRQAADEYLFSGNVVAYLIEKHGQDRFLDLYRSYAELPPERILGALGSSDVSTVARVFESASGGFATETTDVALRRIYGLALRELEVAVKEWLRIPHG